VVLKATGDEEASEPPTEGVGIWPLACEAPATVRASRRCKRSRMVVRAAFGLSDDLREATVNCQFSVDDREILTGLGRSLVVQTSS
jgi:hypothetical protein